LRLHRRMTITDRKLEEKVRRWNIGQVKTTHLVLAQPRE
jgi:hypothetical protein